MRFDSESNYLLPNRFNWSHLILSAFPLHEELFQIFMFDDVDHIAVLSLRNSGHTHSPTTIWNFKYPISISVSCCFQIKIFQISRAVLIANAYYKLFKEEIAASILPSNISTSYGNRKIEVIRTSMIFKVCALPIIMEGNHAERKMDTQSDRRSYECNPNSSLLSHRSGHCVKFAR